jgi:hypothetical protein
MVSVNGNDLPASAQRVPGVRFCDALSEGAGAMKERARPDWGHGPNPPVPVFNEDEIRVLWDKHHPGDHLDDGTVLCSCVTDFTNNQFTADHFIEALKEHHEQALQAQPHA